MRHDLIPFMSVLVTEEEFLAASPDLLQTPIVNVLGNDGQLYVYSRFSLGRYMLTASTKTALGNGLPTMLKEELQPLAFGHKIPTEMLNKILAFFKNVMAMIGNAGTGHGDYEAMAHIVWNTKEQAYRIAIPRQKVAKASVSYTWDHIDPDYETVIFDIHSHNSMGAFYSGTDESDDRSYIGISGVAGRLNTDDPQLIYRFNAFKNKVAMTSEQIFTAPTVTEMPELKMWMENVEVQRAWTAPAGNLSNGYSYKPAGSDPKRQTSVFGVARDRAHIDDHNFIDEGTDLFDGGLSGARDTLDFPGVGLDDIAEDLADKVWNEADDELNAEVAATLARRVVDAETLYDAGLFVITNRTEATAAINRIQSDYTIGR